MKMRLGEQTTEKLSICCKDFLKLDSKTSDIFHKWKLQTINTASVQSARLLSVILAPFHPPPPFFSGGRLKPPPERRVNGGGSAFGTRRDESYNGEIDVGMGAGVARERR
ncbi:hypothetical protein NL676_025068 [Syzygium grande]|nr:hypothetical protein NL676_025068 [Syzygium grande]